MLSFSKFFKKNNIKPLKDDHKNLIKKHFENANFVGETSARVAHKNKEIHFRNDGGKLIASVAHYKTKSDVSSANAVPVHHSDHPITNDDDILKIKN